ncbi:hypothetical protein JQ594_20080 [Bradyrhizobium manausense]|uniref:hypothetical protein n=1 Tax=Bradyrhizobium manausense TaxID=989370 RepID=UPI001BAB21C0|nr:hypothetical protein [Bradyrhizobium manausense]MBR0688237.1 hypothetical protein [Bradyrhizobium manausense]MBR0724374.1 hypothetical protein [Bradyrhizobium manausense]
METLRAPHLAGLRPTGAETDTILAPRRATLTTMRLPMEPPFAVRPSARYSNETRSPVVVARQPAAADPAAAVRLIG